MKLTSLFEKTDQTIMDSIHLYQKSLMEDINLTLRITNNNHTHTTKPVGWEKNLLIFEAPMSQLDYVLYPKNAKVQVVFVSKVALFITHIMITKSYRKNNSLYYVGEIISPIIKKQQREAFRLDVIMDVVYQVLPNELYDDTLLLEEVPLQKGTCVNISIGGMCLNCNEQLHSHDHLSLTFSLLENQPITIIGEILFIGERTEVGTYTHRIKFCGLSNTESNSLNHMIFEKQRLQLRHS